MSICMCRLIKLIKKSKHIKINEQDGQYTQNMNMFISYEAQRSVENFQPVH